MPVEAQIVVYWVVTLCSLEGGHRCFEGTNCIHVTSTLKMEQLYSSRMLVSTYKTTWCLSLEHYNLKGQWWIILKQYGFCRIHSRTKKRLIMAFYLHLQPILKTNLN
jgi:hypothetical protein